MSYFRTLRRIIAKELFYWLRLLLNLDVDTACFMTG